MTENTSASDGRADTIELTYTTTSAGREMTTRTIEIDQYAVEDVLQMAMRGSLEGVDSDTLMTELRARSSD